MAETSVEIPLQPLEPMTEAELETYRLHRRFDRLGRLIGDRSMKKLMDSHVMIVGLGGVGSWAAESIARSGVGTISIVDFDEVCITNSNRQLQALAGLVGQQKAEVLGERLKKVNPQAEIITHVKFFNFNTADALLAKRPDFVIDAIDNVTAKCYLIDRCHRDGIPLISSTGSGGRLDPTRIRVADLGDTEIDPLAKAVRKILRQQYGFPSTGPFGIPAVFSFEPAADPVELHYDGGKGFRCVCPQGQNDLNSCDKKNVIMGNASFVTGTFGLACASYVVRQLTDRI